MCQRKKNTSPFSLLTQEVTRVDKYARWNWAAQRRETWEETVTRAVSFLRELSGNKLPDQLYVDIYKAIFNLEIMPSMRLLASAGESARRNNIALYNCLYLELDSIDALCEVMLGSMNGCGVGFSVESDVIRWLPSVSWPTGEVGRHTVADTTEGWVAALRALLEAKCAGHDVRFDFSKIRPAGAVLKTKGGRASGPEPLEEAFRNIAHVIEGRAGQRLRPCDLTDIACLIASASIAGGVRRSSLIALFDEDDPEMLSFKQGAFWETHPHRSFVNISAVVNNSSNYRVLLEKMDQSGVGEPGLFNREAVIASRPDRRKEARFGTNPCGEIALRSMQCCNLTSVIVRPNDTPSSVVRKAYLATVVGTIQSAASYFPGFRPEWEKNAKEERLLGVDLNGLMDNPGLIQAPFLETLKGIVVAVNIETARILGIAQSAATTTIKPSGNSSQLVNSASGLHPRWAPYYIRRMRFNRKSPVLRVLKLSGFPAYPENGYTEENTETWVVPFKVMAPSGAICRGDITALQQLETVKLIRSSYAEHQISVTITYRPEEFWDIVKWVEENRHHCAGLSFLPHSGGNYPLSPYEEITEAEYRRLRLPKKINWDLLDRIETEDFTTASREISCSGGLCDI